MANRSGPRSGLAGTSIDDLRKELARRNRLVARKVKQWQKLKAKSDALEQEVNELGGSVHTGGMAKRPKNESNLVDALTKVLTDKVMSVTEVTAAVQHAGYMTTSPSFRTIVNQTLINSGKFKRVERGRYTVK